MSNKISNPFLKQLISGISKKANEGRINDISWGTLSEARASIKTEAGEKDVPDAEDTEDPLAGVEGDAGAEGAEGEDPLAGAEGEEGEDPLAGAEGEEGEDPLAGAGGEEGVEGEDPDKIAADTVQKKAQAAANSAELKQAEKKLETTKPYIELDSTNGIRFLLSKVLDHAFNTRTIDTFSKDMMTALNVKTKSDVSSFVKDHLQPFVADKNLGKSIPELIEKMTANAIPDQDPTPEAASSDESLG